MIPVTNKQKVWPIHYQKSGRLLLKIAKFFLSKILKKVEMTRVVHPPPAVPDFGVKIICAGNLLV